MYHTIIFGLTNTKTLPIAYLKCHLTECPIFSLATVLVIASNCLALLRCTAFFWKKGMMVLQDKKYENPVFAPQQNALVATGIETI